jgi:hypothetical protein
MAPKTVERAAFEENAGADTGAIVDAELLNVENDSH